MLVDLADREAGLRAAADRVHARADCDDTEAVPWGRQVGRRRQRLVARAKAYTVRIVPDGASPPTDTICPAAAAAPVPPRAPGSGGSRIHPRAPGVQDSKVRRFVS